MINLTNDLYKKETTKKRHREEKEIEIGQTSKLTFVYHYLVRNTKISYRVEQEGLEEFTTTYSFLQACTPSRIFVYEYRVCEETTGLTR